jgi:hypothetical protein
VPAHFEITGSLLSGTPTRVLERSCGEVQLAEMVVEVDLGPPLPFSAFTRAEELAASFTLSDSHGSNMPGVDTPHALGRRGVAHVHRHHAWLVRFAVEDDVS